MMPARLGAIALLLLIAGDIPATEDASVVAGDASRGKLLFRDDFTHGAGPGWTYDRTGVWTGEDGHLRAELPAEKQQRSFAFVGSEKWTDYVVDVDVCGLKGADKGVAIRVAGEKKGVGLDLRGGRYHDLLVYRGFEHWARAAVTNVNGTWYHLRIEARRNRYRVYVDGHLEIDFTDESNSRPRGRIALAAYTGGVGACTVLYDNVEVRALR